MPLLRSSGFWWHGYLQICRSAGAATTTHIFCVYVSKRVNEGGKEAKIWAFIGKFETMDPKKCKRRALDRMTRINRIRALTTKPQSKSVHSAFRIPHYPPPRPPRPPLRVLRATRRNVRACCGWCPSSAHSRAPIRNPQSCYCIISRR